MTTLISLDALVRWVGVTHFRTEEKIRPWYGYECKERKITESVQSM